MDRWRGWLAAGFFVFLALAAYAGSGTQQLRLPDASLQSTAAGDPGVPLTAVRVLFRPPSIEMLDGPEGVARVALGKLLFNDARLSADGKTSCATCHDPAQSFTDGRKLAVGHESKRRPRNSPSLWNVGMARAFFWDGRAASLEAQAKDAIEADMASTVEAAIGFVMADAAYATAFADAFGSAAPNGANLLAALAAYERTLRSPETRFDRWVQGDDAALTNQEFAGLRLFMGAARCMACHGGWRFTDDKFHDAGVRSNDPGRQAITGGAERAFKTPSLREAVWSAPYMHDGSMVTLADVIDHYAGQLAQRPSLAPELKRGIILSTGERADLLAFLKTLSSDSMPKQ